MRLALAQIDPTIGDLAGNAALIARFTDQARAQRTDMVVFPELALTGYPPKDLLLQQGFMQAVTAAAKSLGESASRGITLVFGTPLQLDDHGHRLANSLLAYRDGKLLAWYDKRLLPTYDVFDENRYFTPGEKSAIVEVAGVHVGLSICEDLWRGEDVGFAERYINSADPVEDLIHPRDGTPGAQLIVNPSASPFVLGKGRRHRDLLRKHAMQRGVHVAAVNQVGGNDELIFDGHACAFDPKGNLIAAGPGFAENVLVVEIPVRGAEAPLAAASGSAGVVDPLLNTADEELIYRALELGVRDYCRKTGFKSAVLGLSGGIDSAVTCVLAAAALGRKNVLALAMPSRYSSEGSRSDAAELAKRLGSPYQEVPIEGPFKAFESTLAPLFQGRQPDVAEENIQSRIRGTILMAASNKLGHILLTTGNKSELAVGFCTLYGDMNGGLAVLSDVTKVMVYRLARWMNEHWQELGIEGLKGPPIPEASITKAPSAELRPNQTDQDSLPPYHILDEIIERYVGRREAPSAIVRDSGIDTATVARVVRMIDLAEFKRKQAPVGLKVTGVAFGSGRRMPIAQGWRADKTI